MNDPRPWHLVISCEHASNRVPEGLDLGVHPDVLTSHVAWDPGALEVATRTALAVGAPLLVGTYSRLVVDLNRLPDSPAVIPEVSFGVEVPGNRALSDSRRERRLAALHAPYRHALREAVARPRARVLHLSVHSFTLDLDHGYRGHDVGILVDPARATEVAWTDHLRSALEAEGFETRMNEPYSGVGDSGTSWLRTLFADARYAGLEIELSQRLDRPALAAVADALARACAAPVRAPTSG